MEKHWKAMAEFWEKRHGAAIVLVIAFLGGGWWLRGQFDRLDGKIVSLDLKIAILAMNIPAEKKQDLLKTVDLYRASLPSDPEKALSFVLGNGPKS